MRKSMRLLLLLLVAGLAFTGCKKDKDDKDLNIVGKWEIFNAHYKEFKNGQLEPEEPAYDVSVGDGSYHIMEFKTDKTFIIQYSSVDDVKGTYRIEGKKLYLKEEGETEDVIDINVSGNVLTLHAVDIEVDGTDTWRTEFTGKYKKL
jgi:hypothetical protein